MSQLFFEISCDVTILKSYHSKKDFYTRDCFIIHPMDDQAVHSEICRILSIDPHSIVDVLLQPDNVIVYILENLLNQDPHATIDKLVQGTVIVHDSTLSNDQRDEIFKNITLALGLILIENPLSILSPNMSVSFHSIPVGRILGYLVNQYELHDLKTILDPTIGHTIQLLKDMTLEDSANFIAEFFRSLSQLKDGPRLLTESQYWNRKLNQPLNSTILGALLSVSNFAKEQVMQDYFKPNITVREMDESFLQIRSYSRQYLGIVENVIKSILHCKELRHTIVSWIVNNVLNDPNFKKKSTTYHQLEWENNLKLQQDDGFYLNLSYVLLLLCLPFVKSISSPNLLADKLKLIDYTYCLANEKELGLTNEPWILLKDQDASVAQLPNPPKEYGFVSTIFFTTLIVLYRGLVSTYEKYNNFSRKVYNLQKKLENTHVPSERASLKESLDTLFSLKLTMESYLCDPEWTQYSLDYFGFTSHWLFGLLDSPEKLNCVPEFTLTMLSKYMVLVLQDMYNRYYQQTPSIDPKIASVFIHIIGSNALKAVHLTEAALETLIHFSCPQLIASGFSPTIVDKLGISNPLLSDPTATSLIPGLMRFYIDVERSDTPNSYYRKFYTRDRISKLLMHMSTLPQFEPHINAVTNQTSLFLSFMRVVISDATFHLDELVVKLPKLKSLELVRSETNNWSNESQEIQQERMDEYNSTENIVASSAIFSNQSIGLLHYFSSYNVEALKDVDLSQRVATILNYFLWYFAGPNRRNLAIDQKDKLHFKPRLILKMLVETFIHFHERTTEFSEFIIKDGRFEFNTFENALTIIKEKSICNEQTVSQFSEFMQVLKDKSTQLVEEDIPLDEIPEEFLDPLMYTLMENPVKLPSGMNMDKQVITRYLETNPTDPFNRNPLTPEQLVDNVELKQRILEWKNSRK